MSTRKAVNQEVKMNVSEVRDLLTFIVENNKKLVGIGELPISLNIKGPSGVGKTSVIKQVFEKMEMPMIKKNLSQIDDLSEITGFPIKEYEVLKTEKDVQKVRWVPEAILSVAAEKGWVSSGKIRMGYAKPEWLVGNDKTPIGLVLDDFNRCQPRFLQAIMEIVDNQTYFSWTLPKGSTVVLSSNPDNGEYNVTTEDTAQTSRYFEVNCKFDAKIWARYAESINVDERG